MNRKLSKAILFGLPALVFLACTGEDGEESTGKKDAGESAAGEVGNWDIVTDPVFKKDSLGTFATTKIKVKNVSDDNDTPWFEIRLTDKAGDLVATYDCIGDEVEPGQQAQIECISTDEFAQFKDYEIKNAF
ncbi:FxLYD domain-containing protein [Nocardioides caeni]|uniref:Uncharacterized protein n=1 Tax=Nocardioides caeni TaxID=574700 RepID=A0A4S8NLC7_9ACTN|nr:FxLYD domain-containing protein [Nocardioides caeni]THV17800.1 hypothetical protein E9934_04870 [Nocardioides caeni]